MPSLQPIVASFRLPCAAWILRPNCYIRASCSATFQYMNLLLGHFLFFLGHGHARKTCLSSFRQGQLPIKILNVKLDFCSLQKSCSPTKSTGVAISTLIASITLSKRQYKLGICVFVWMCIVEQYQEGIRGNSCQTDTDVGLWLQILVRRVSV